MQPRIYYVLFTLFGEFLNTKLNVIIDTIESENKRWYCEACPLNFGTVDELRQHEKIHDAEKPFVCILCQKDFSLKSSLSRHIVASHGVDPTPLIESDKCLKKSVQESNMQTPLIKEEQNITKDNSMSPFSTDVSCSFE